MIWSDAIFILEFFIVCLFVIYFSNEMSKDGNNIKLASIANNKVVETNPPNAIVPS